LIFAGNHGFQWKTYYSLDTETPLSAI
jgi:hypothetical protein